MKTVIYGQFNWILVGFWFQFYTIKNRSSFGVLCRIYVCENLSTSFSKDAALILSITATHF